GGQQQRIAIARAFLRNSKLMLLDEWSSALDQETERTINRTIDEMRSGRTVVVVDHNLRFDKKTTRVFVLDGGRIVASGKHAQLMKTSPLYAKLVSIARDNAAEPK
ncbi:MAG TPA: ATP-binding cassette domain-containing protein, partial [Elusimicrobiota bacterium]|nr:ATP-binding cassette domain-containing protein [Elusimicrobiota bacterium]